MKYYFVNSRHMLRSTLVAAKATNGMGGFMEGEPSAVNCGSVDQPGRLPPSQGGGRGFKSRPVHHRSG